MATGTTEMPASTKGSFREKYCPSHLQVEWEVSCEILQNSGDDLRSPVFKIGRQSYMLESKLYNNNDVALSLLRMGPSVSDRSFVGQFWGGLKHADGDYDLIYDTEQSDLKSELKSFSTQAFFWLWTSTTDLQRHYLTPDGCLKFFLRMNIKRPLVGVETCTHGTPRMPNPEAGNILQEECQCHQHVQWNISYSIQQEHSFNLTSPTFNLTSPTFTLTSPVFKIGTQMYFFQLSPLYVGDVKFHLFRLGPSVDGPAADVRYWIGLKCRDGTYCTRNFSDKLDLSEDFGLWTEIHCLKFCKSDLEKLYLTQDRLLTFFLRMNVDSTGADICRHGTPDQIVPQAAGSIREEPCSSHKQVEWEVDYKAPQDDANEAIKLTSPVFTIGTQAYFFETCFEAHGGVGLHLFRLGPSVGGPSSTPRCWVGLKRSDGTYHYNILSMQVDLREDFGLWTHVEFVMYIWPSNVKELYLTPDSRLTFLFRMNTETTGPQMCTHGLTEMPSSVTGRIRETVCSSHKEVEWDIDCEELLENKFVWTSHAFKIDTQMYYLVLDGNMKYNASFGLYRLGCSVEGPASIVRCWAGLKYLDGTYPPRHCSKKLDLHEHLELWTLVTFFMHFHNARFDENVLKSMKRLTFFIRMNVEPTGTEKCVHDPVTMRSSRGEGSIQIQECASHSHVLWDAEYEASQNTCASTSPVFKVGNQSYYLYVCYDSRESITLELYRSGYPFQGPTSSARCYAGLKSNDGSYQHHIQKAEVDISEEFLLPAIVASFVFPGRDDLERTHVTSDGRLAFFLQLNVSHATVDEVTCAHGAVEMCPPGEGSIRERNDNLVEWDVGYQELRDYTHFTTSPVFKMGVQCYLLELCYEIDGILALSLFRFGRSVDGPAGFVRCWAGLKRDSGMYYHNIEGVELDLSRDCELWTKVRILGNFRRCTIENQCLTRDGRLTFFFLISAEARQSKGVAVQTEGNTKGGHKVRFSQHSEDFKKLRQDLRLWLEHPEEGDNIRRRRLEEFEAKRWKILEKQLKEDKEPSIFAA